ncbi:hypothetical protein AAHB54_25335 [Bacillus cereus]
MDFRKYEYNIQQFLDRNYTNLKNIKVGASEESIQEFIKMKSQVSIVIQEDY